MDIRQEVEIKIGRVRGFLEARGLRGALLATHANFAWITGGGRNHVSTATEQGAAAVLVTADASYLLANNIERRRLEEEETTGLSFEAREFPWWAGGIPEAALELAPAEQLCADIPLPSVRRLSATELLALRNPLLEPEIARYRRLGEETGIVMTHAAFHCRPGLSEHQLAGMLAGGLSDYGITPAVLLAAVDERVSDRRHPLPTGRRLQRYAMLVVGARRQGLNLSTTRLVHFGAAPSELRERHAACARVDAAFLAATTEGAALADIFRAGQAAYAAEGYPDEWRLHHQGGPTGYAAREFPATPEVEGRVQLHQAFAWNPSITGTKSEDTVLVADGGLEVLSPTPDLPTLEVEAAGRRFMRPAILER